MIRQLLILISLSLAIPALAQEPLKSSLEDKISKKDKRHPTFRYALDCMTKRKAQILVETGTARGGRSNCAGDGCSTPIFAEWANQHGALLYSVDIDRSALITAERCLGDLYKYVKFVHSDSVAFLKNFNQKIDFLYLDSYDFDFKNPRPSQQHHYQEIVAAYPWLTDQTIILIDDCDLPHGGKGKLVIEFLLEKGWKIACSGYSCLNFHR